jgi:glutamine cyclotransferase
MRDQARRPVRDWQAWLAILCIVAIAAACALISAGIATLSSPAASEDTPVTTAVTPPPTRTSAATPPPTATVGETSRTTTPLAPPAAPSATSQEATPIYGYRVVNEYPHDPSAFTQGLVYEEGVFYEGTGLTLGRSSLRKVALETGEVLQSRNLEPEYFGEGISVVGEHIWQLTWQNHVAFLYDKGTFEQLDTVQYPTEGWGLTYDGERLIMSDGTATLYFRDPNTFEVLGQVAVYDEQGPVTRLNELEYIDGQVLANVWMTDYIAVIDPSTGRVDAWLDLAGLRDQPGLRGEIDVLNGIAYDAAGDRLFVTGKLWPTLYEIEIVADDAVAFLPLVSQR